MAYEAVVFDWDGTLVDSEHHIVSSIRHAAKQMQLPELGHDQLKNIIGLGMREALLSLYPGLTEAQILAMRDHYSQYFFSRETDQSTLFEGVVETLEALKVSGVRLAVATGKSRNGLEKALTSTKLRRFFEIERCADETLSKPNPLMLQQISDYFSLPAESMLMVGDTEYDLVMATRQGMDAIAVSYGVHESDRLRKHNPLEIVDHLSEIISFI
jgi:phosphoglycolate phosphatase